MEDQMTCIKCGGSENLNKTKPSNTSIEKLVDYAKLRTQYGESEYKPLHDKLQLLDKHKLENIKWHSDCYKTIVHKGKLKRAEERFLAGNSYSPVVGRPSSRVSASTSKSDKCTLKRSIRDSENECVFNCGQPSNKYSRTVHSDSIGSKLINIKNLTSNDKVRANLAFLSDPGDAQLSSK